MTPVWHRRRLVHVVQDLSVNSITMQIYAWVLALDEYHHTVLFEGDVMQADSNLWQALTAAGADVLHVAQAVATNHVGPLPPGSVTAEMLREGEYSAAILHSIRGHAGLGRAVPSIYYSYGVYDAGIQPDIVACCTQYALTTGRYGPHALPANTCIIPPGISSRALRSRKAPTGRFTVGISNSGGFGQYPIRLVRNLMTYLPDDVALYISAPDKWHEELNQLGLLARKSALLVPVKAYPSGQLLQRLNVLIQGYHPNYYSPYSKTVIEAMCMGIPVVCQRNGFLATQLIDEQHCLFFNTREEALEKVLLLRQHTDAATNLGLNGRMWALGQDQTVYVNRLRSLLRQLGA